MRLQNTRISHEPLEDSDNFEYGFNANFLRTVIRYWAEKFDWRKQEAIIHRFPQFTTEIDGLKDLRMRLQNTRISHEPLEDSDNFEYGFNANFLRTVIRYWAEKFDWRKQEAIIHRFPQFTTEIDGLKLDREYRDQCDLVVEAVDSGSPPRYGSCTKMSY
ncbi:unnamed protein product [Toxocara canis]|uniref:EHN domain-containing protein n=1 Tax=Toxocara canis TaxID=6265 RepID=A0A183V3Y1_TOXCA|nr:unnamed protein product [Toxocara canis]